MKNKHIPVMNVIAKFYVKYQQLEFSIMVNLWSIQKCNKEKTQPCKHAHWSSDKIHPHGQA